MNKNDTPKCSCDGNNLDQFGKCPHTQPTEPVESEEDVESFLHTIHQKEVYRQEELEQCADKAFKAGAEAFRLKVMKIIQRLEVGKPTYRGEEKVYDIKKAWLDETKEALLNTIQLDTNETEV